MNPNCERILGFVLIWDGWKPAPATQQDIAEGCGMAGDIVYILCRATKETGWLVREGDGWRITESGREAVSV